MNKIEKQETQINQTNSINDIPESEKIRIRNIVRASLTPDIDNITVSLMNFEYKMQQSIEGIENPKDLYIPYGNPC